MDFNPYKVLAIDPSADTDVISAVYRTLSKKYHPDINKSPEAEQRMREINRAYEMLKDPAQRRKVDEELARENNRGAASGTRPATGYTTSRPTTQARPRPAAPDFSNIGEQFDQLRRRAEGVINNVRSGVDVRPGAPDDRTLYFYKKQLLDEAQRKNLKVAVYHDGATNRKICNILCSAPNARGQVTTGEVFLDSQGMFDLTLAVSEAERMLQEPSNPVEMHADHDVYYREAVGGLGRTFIAVEVIKRPKGTAKEVLLLIGEKNARTEKDGVVSDQSPSRLQQIGRVFKSALEAMR
ncbi:MAG TPA: DnaJ domain-containing protein [Chloroflexia bacterium]|nr:DnaJ domain-containing protein [Chloroflexia bacterium]